MEVYDKDSAQGFFVRGEEKKVGRFTVKNRKITGQAGLHGFGKRDLYGIVRDDFDEINWNYEIPGSGDSTGPDRGYELLRRIDE